MHSFLSSSATEQHVGASTPNRRDAQKLNIRLSPIPGRNAALFRRSEFSDTNLLSTHSVASTYRGNFTTRTTLMNCLEISKVRNFGYVNIQATKILPIVIRNRYAKVVMLGIKLAGSESDVFKVVNSEDENRCVESGCETVINVSFTPTKRTSYNRSLVITVIPDRRSGLVLKRYEVCLVGHGGTVILRVSQDKTELAPVKVQTKLAVRWNGHYDARMYSNRRSTLTLKNNGERVAFVFVKALTQDGDEVSQNRLSVSPNTFLLNKLCFEAKNVNIQVLDERLWQKMVHGGEEIRLAIYSVVERQRMRLIEYGRVRNQQVGPIEDIDFTTFNFDAGERVAFDRATISSEDLRVFKDELRVNFIRLLPPSVLGQINEQQELDENRYALLPLQFEDDIVREFDDSEETCR